MEVVLIDSGISQRLQDRCVGGMDIKWNNNTFVYGTDILDENGHGSYCADVIMRVCPDASFYVIKIVDGNGYSSSGLLYKAFEACKKRNTRIICVSLSVIKELEQEKITDVIKELRDMGKIICVSVENGKECSFPANLSSVIGVKGRIFYNQSFYIHEKEDSNIVYFDSTPIVVRHPEGEYKFFYGNSKANAVCVGTIANILNKSPTMSVEECWNLLISNAKVEFPVLTANEMSYFTKKISYQDAELFSRMVYKFNGKDIGLVQDYLAPVLSKRTGINMDNVICFLQVVERELQVKIDYENLSFSNIFYLGELIEYLEGIAK